MKWIYFAGAVLLMAGLQATAAAQSIVINDPLVDMPFENLSPAERRTVDRLVLPKARKALANEGCEESFESSGVIRGSFTARGAQETLIFYQFCQTGNGHGSVGVAILDNGKVAGNHVSAQSGWTAGALALPDINQNGIDEFALYYSGGIHQGAGGVGVDIYEIASGKIKGLGWFQAESFQDDSDTIRYKVTVQKGKVPSFKREKYVLSTDEKWKQAGKPAAFRLEKAYGTFVALK